MTDFLLCLVFAGSVTCAILLSVFLRRGEELAKVLETQIRGLDETHMLGFQALTNELRRLENRVKKVEDAMP